jgi:copper chaperone
MDKTVHIEGMSCKHCAMRVEKALKALGASAVTVNLDAKTASIQSPTELTDATIAQAVSDAGYRVVQ